MSLSVLSILTLFFFSGDGGGGGIKVPTLTLNVYNFKTFSSMCLGIFRCDMF